jgi:Domain of unknown function (DUF4159)
VLNSVALIVAGRLRAFLPKRRAATLALGFAALAAVTFAVPERALAQYDYQLMPDGSYRSVSTESRIVPLPGNGAPQKQVEAALEMRLAYVETADNALNARTRAGLIGISNILLMRTSVEPAEPHALNLETDALELYPLIYFNVPGNAAPLSDKSVQRLNAYLRSGGALLIDTRAGETAGSQTDVTSLETLLEGLDVPPLQPVPQNHVLSRSFYLINDFPGRFAGRRLWIEQAGDAAAPRGDGVSRLFIGDADWASAWAVDENGRDLYSVDGGAEQRETARRFGVNLVMYVLTGSYKDDQVHIPALLERLGEDEGNARDPRLPVRIPDGGPQ